MIKNIIFDFDGVLVDSETIILKAFIKYMQESEIKTNEKPKEKRTVLIKTIFLFFSISSNFFPVI